MENRIILSFFFLVPVTYFWLLQFPVIQCGDIQHSAFLIKRKIPWNFHLLCLTATCLVNAVCYHIVQCRSWGLRRECRQTGSSYYCVTYIKTVLYFVVFLTVLCQMPHKLAEKYANTIPQLAIKRGPASSTNLPAVSSLCWNFYRR